MATSPLRSPRRDWGIPSWDTWINIVAVCLCSLAVLRGIWVTSDLLWPFGSDQLRDIAIAETVVRGELLSDPYYANEWLWYPPLFPWLVGGAAFIADVPASLANVRLGPYLNALSPLAFFALASLWFGRRAALASLCAFLFLDRGPYWLAPTYSPWLLPGSSSQAIFFGGLIALTHAVREPTVTRWGLVGAVLGLTFLGHSAPAVLLGAVTLAAIVSDAVVTMTLTRPARHLVVVLAAAVTVSGPLLVSIGGHYGLHLRNGAGLHWIDPAIEIPLRELLLPGGSAFFASVLAVFGVACMARGWRGVTRGNWLALSWLALSLGLFVYQVYAIGVIRRGGSSSLPVVSPPHHFLFYLRASLLLAFGVGVDALCTGLATLSTRVAPRVFRRDVVGGRALFAAVIGLLLVVNSDGWWRKAEFNQLVDSSRAVFAPVEWRALIGWMRYRTSPDDVFIAADGPALSFVGATGRKLVALHKFFANPYVDVRPRLETRERFWSALAAGDCAAAQRLARRYRATYVVHGGPVAVPRGACGLRTAFEIPGVRIDRLPSP
jgi:hypothetical protein